MKFMYDKASCQNIRRSLTYEWLETNALGDYSSSSIPCCNTRKYHGLYVANLANPNGRHVLLSTLEESLVGLGKEFFISTRKHPDIFYPRGHEHQTAMEYDLWSKFLYQIGELKVVKEVLMPYKKSMTLIRYSFSGSSSGVDLVLRLKPLLAFRNFHALTVENSELNPICQKIKLTNDQMSAGYSIQPYPTMPKLFMHLGYDQDHKKSKLKLENQAVWYKNIEYLAEKVRGFSYYEDLFMPQTMEIKVDLDSAIYFGVSTEAITEDLATLWQAEITRRQLTQKDRQKKIFGQSPVATHLANEADKFIIENKLGLSQIIAGYPWFDAWGRDTLISLPGLTFCQNKKSEGIKLLDDISSFASKGLVPNMFSPHGTDHSYNSVDASLWFVWAVQQMEILNGTQDELIRERYFPVIKSIINNFRSNSIPTVFIDDEQLLHAGNAHTQLTWMDANCFGKPVTPRNGCPVEINALWYNAIAYADLLARRYNDPAWQAEKTLRTMEKSFLKRFWVHEKNSDGYLADLWHSETQRQDTKVRPNQIIAVALPFSILDSDFQPAVVEKVRNSLLTPFGLRTLAPNEPEYIDEYYGSSEMRDSAYHQGAVWPWLLGSYADALIRTAWDTEAAVSSLLTTISPLISKHLREAGIGSISEIFEGVPPHRADGTIAQAWSVAEVLRLLHFMYETEPKIYAEWEQQLLLSMNY